MHPFEQLAELRDRTQQVAALHCDGARIWNASVATGVKLYEYGALFDTLSVCLSKGLGAPVGSLVVDSELSGRRRPESCAAGSAEACDRPGSWLRPAATRSTTTSNALADDHAHARLLAEACGVDPQSVDTNIVLIFVRDAPSFVAAARAEGVLVSAVAPDRVRLVTSLAVDPDAVRRAAGVLSKLPHN